MLVFSEKVTVQGKSKLNARLHKLGFPLDCHIMIKSVPGNEKEMGNAITNKYEIIAPKHMKISNSQTISQLIVHPDIISYNFVAYCM